ncbi:hypothetical protein SAMN04487926_1553 [Paraburkholderia steynii]|uniref:Uncharacterized protein n=1 Tax=Paraburkholderia steynii TaxID=1245441 RepID=A0A7Z7BKW4_9BURK|nr:hypothetical protein SAMN04487926_1553 [Paraburkholderia steynii]
MRFIRKVWSFFFPSGAEVITILGIALTVSAVSCSCFILWLWIVHTPESLTTDGAARTTCLSRCERTCSPSAG